MEKESYINIKNPGILPLNSIPVIEYNDFYNQTCDLLQTENCHCINYFGIPVDDSHIKIFCLIANDGNNTIAVYSSVVNKNEKLSSITAKHFAMHVFEREIAENFGLQYTDHPWLKPLRYSFNRYNKDYTIENYPFYTIESDQLHEVGVGPIHAGIIEPGYFRFICKGEDVLHLEIQLGYQHRGIEDLFIKKNSPLQHIVLSENIAGDTAVSHSLANTMIWETLNGFISYDNLNIERSIASELERIGIHIGDTAALCTDVAYQLGQVVNEALRTIVINTTQLWCGNRFGKGLLRPCGTHYPLSDDVKTQILKNLEEVEKRYNTITDRIFTSPSVLSRFEGIGIVTLNQAKLIGAVGMAARMTGIPRDIRYSHPYSFYNELKYKPVTLNSGDVFARAMLRKLEVEKSINLIRQMISLHKNELPKNPEYNIQRKPFSLAVACTEGWRGEICHCAITDEKGDFSLYKVKDPSMHNWMALAIAVRNQEISDFPICNKSFNLSYCGHDL